METPDLPAALATVWRIESPRVIARLVRLVGDIDTDEELAQDTSVAVAEKWERGGIPNNPAAWFNTTPPGDLVSLAVRVAPNRS